MTTSPIGDPDPASPFIDGSDLAISFSDPFAEDEPLTYVNGVFCRLVGYGRDECLGRNCRFLQGEGTDPAAVRRVREGIEARAYRLTPLVNYRSGGQAFMNGLLVGPVNDDEGRVMRLVGLQWDIGRTLERRQAYARMQYRVQSMPARHLERFERLIARVAEASARHDVAARFPLVVERLVAISRPQQYPPHERLPDWTRAGSLLSYLAEPYGDDVTARLHILGGETQILALDVAHPLALAVHELAFATERQARQSGVPPRIRLSCALVPTGTEPALELVWQAAASGPERLADQACAATRAGFAVVSEVVAMLGGRFDAEIGERGIEAVLRVPNRMRVSPS